MQASFYTTYQNMIIPFEKLQMPANKGKLFKVSRGDVIVNFTEPISLLIFSSLKPPMLRTAKI